MKSIITTKLQTIYRSPEKNAKTILFIGATHGNEPLGIRIFKALSIRTSPCSVDWIIGNPKAYAEKKRFLQSDLNRSAPGKKYSKLYEMRRAHELVNIARNYNYIIDIHGTNAHTGIFTIVTNPSKANLELAAALPPKNIVIWATSARDSFGALSKHIPSCVEIECGKKYSKKTYLQIESIIKNIITRGIHITPKNMAKKNWFRVTEKWFIKNTKNIKKKDVKKLKEFTKITLSDDTFYPLLIGRYEGVICHKMDKISYKKI